MPTHSPVLHLQPCNNEPEDSVTSTRPLPMGQRLTCACTRKAIAHLVLCKESSLLTALSTRNGASKLWNANSCCRLVAHGKKGVNDMSEIFLQNKDCSCATKKENGSPQDLYVLPKRYQFLCSLSLFLCPTRSGTCFKSAFLPFFFFLICLCWCQIPGCCGTAGCKFSCSLLCFS